MAPNQQHQSTEGKAVKDEPNYDLFSLYVVLSPAAPQIWNHIPTAIRVSPSLDSFKHHL